MGSHLKLIEFEEVWREGLITEHGKLTSGDASGFTGLALTCLTFGLRHWAFGVCESILLRQGFEGLGPLQMVFRATLFPRIHFVVAFCSAAARQVRFSEFVASAPFHWWRFGNLKWTYGSSIVSFSWGTSWVSVFPQQRRTCYRWPDYSNNL